VTTALRATLGWRLSSHARVAAASRGFTVAEVLLAAVSPEVRYTSYGYGEDREVRVAGDVAVVVNARTRTVITVLWHHGTEWTDEQARSRAESLPLAA
jgi:hypothetical protein